MPEISDSVGEGAPNKKSDVAIVQVMLVLIKNAKNASYLPSYDGDYGRHTKDAIVAFQKDHVFVAQPGYVDAGAGLAAAVPAAKSGVIQPGDATFAKLAEMLPDDYADITTLDDSNVVYLPATDDDVTASKKDLDSRGLDDHFKVSVASLIDEMYDKHDIVLAVTPAWAKGGRRTFQVQYDLLFEVDDKGNPVTNAGPGESNHNFGQAVDIGFNGLRWLKPDGSIMEKEDWWLHKLEKTHHGAAKALQFWDVMRDVATQGDAGLFRGPVKDRPHVQAWDDKLVDMANRLAHLLTDAGAMKWTGFQQAYKCDFGLGGDLYSVGSAQQIWNLQAHIRKNDLAKARTAALRKAALQAGPQSDAFKKFKPVTQIEDEEITAMRKALKDDFLAAEKHWDDWTSQ
jgi:hypothetical protein